MRIGIVSPIVTHLPGVASPWETTAGIRELAEVAAHADALGFDHLTCSEHVAVPRSVAEVRGGTYWDPLATFGYLAARTSHIRLATQVLVLGYHHPLEIAKRYGTLDAVSGGRLVLGLGVGSLEEEFELLGAKFEGRGALADDAMRALRAALGQRLPSYSGEHYEFSDFVIEPHAVQPKIPFWVGGRSRRSLRRAVELGTGWVPFGLPLAEMAQMLAEVELPAGFEVVLSAGRPQDPLGAPEQVRERIDAIVETGATIVNISVAADSLPHYLDQLSALAQIADVPAPTVS